ncbi:MAG: hypothetical protein HYS05_10010 [Acidobacteria bacterium]|nr:hypothetical protein [Acidobacteriota bacterium]
MFTVTADLMLPEVWIHTCWGNPNMQRVMEDTSYANSIELYLERCKGDVWTRPHTFRPPIRNCRSTS